MNVNEKSRSDLIEELVGLITGSLAFRSDQEIEGILESMKVGESIAVNGLRSTNNSVIICVNPAAGKEDTVAALQELAERIESSWEEVASSDATPPAGFVAEDESLLN